MSQVNQQDMIIDTSRQKQTISQLAQHGDIAKARQLCDALCEQVPGDPEAWFLLGAINGAIPDYPAAERCCRKALELAPGHPMLRFNLAIALLRQGKAVEAIEQFERALAIQPDFAEAYRELGNAQSMNNEPLRAISSFKKSAALDAGCVSTYFNLGSTYLDLNRLDDAAGCFQQALALQPDFIDAHAKFATVLIYQFKFDNAIAYLEQATARLPHAAALYQLLANAHHQQGDTDTALEYYNKALSIDPGSINARSGLAGVLAFQGKYTEAGELLEQLLESNPESPLVKTTYTTFAHQFGAGGKAREIAELELSKKDTETRSQTIYHFALAQLYEKHNDFDKAYEHYTKGNQLRGAHFNYASTELMFTTIIDYFTSETLARLPRSGNTSENLVFIVGMPRSGTSLAEQILASHPGVFGGGELHYINRMVNSIQHKLRVPTSYPHCLDNVTPETLNQFAEQYSETVYQRSAGSSGYFTDKMPVNFMHLGFITLLFPNAKIVHCTRDARDTCLSCYFKLFSGELPYAYSLTDLGRYYHLYQRMMAHWNQVLPGSIHELNYEKLVMTQEAETRKLVEFCGMGWDDACLDFHKTDRTVTTASHDQVREPMYARSIGRWRTYEKHLQPLFTSLASDS